MAEGRILNRTWLCSVLFTDLVNYSSQSVETQINWKGFFNRSVAEAVKGIPVEDRVILDTGDGAALCFLGDPESALSCSLAVLSDFRSNQSPNAPLIRLGIHLGPVKLVEDLNGNPNAIGDGINVGQRIMSFAGHNQILVSRAYFEVVSRLSDEYSRLFRFEGIRQDKHVREHAIYALVPSVESSEILPVEPALPANQVLLENPPGTAAFEPDALAKIETCLRDMIGPIAPYRVKQATLKATTLEQLCEHLAATAVDSKEKDLFLGRCRQALGAKFATARPTPPPTASEAESPNKPDWDEAYLAKLKKELADHIGPVASIMVDRAARKARTRDELLSILAEHTPAQPRKKRWL